MLSLLSGATGPGVFPGLNRGPTTTCRHGCGKQFPWKFTEGAKRVVHHAREARGIHEKFVVDRLR